MNAHPSTTRRIFNIQPRVVLSGSFRRNPAGLARIYRELDTTGCQVLSPLSLDFLSGEEFVRTPAEHQLEMRAGEVERHHLQAIHHADFLWLYAPEGYVGISGSFELGYAAALGKPIFCNERPEDEMLNTQVTVVSSVYQAIETVEQQIT